MRKLAHAVVLADGISRGMLALASGAVGALAMPPFGFWPALAVSLTVAVWLIDGSSGDGRSPALSGMRRAAAAGWLWGFGYFVAGLWWLGSAFLVQPDLFAWLMPFGVLGLPAVLAFFPAIGFAVARLLWSRGAGRVFALAFGLSVAEWLRGHLFTGFPWNTLGMAFGQNLWLMQAASIVGLYGLTALAVILCAAPATIGTGEGARGRVLPSLLAAGALLATATFGAIRLSGQEAAAVPGVQLRIVQPNVAQDEKFRPESGAAVLRHYLDLSGRGSAPDGVDPTQITHLVWPESAFPFLLHREPEALARIARSLPKAGVLITGAARSSDPEAAGERVRYYNSIQVVTDDGAITASYDKVHLVPFGEYVPDVLDRGLRALGLRQFVSIPGGFTPGSRRSALSAPGLPPIAGSVCYEAIFPDETVPPGPRPGLILNVTNDGWFGNTPGPRQHFAQARLRAVERGLPLVRAANTGISAVVDPYGRVLQSLEVGREGVIDSGLPSVAPTTIFSQAGAPIVGSVFAFCLMAAVVCRRIHSSK